MRVATWNMNYWPRASKQREEAWALLAGLQLDVALGQEGVPTPGWRAIYQPGENGKRWRGSREVCSGWALRGPPGAPAEFFRAVSHGLLGLLGGGCRRRAARR